MTSDYMTLKTSTIDRDYHWLDVDICFVKNTHELSLQCPIVQRTCWWLYWLSGKCSSFHWWSSCWYTNLYCPSHSFHSFTPVSSGSNIKLLYFITYTLGSHPPLVPESSPPYCSQILRWPIVYISLYDQIVVIFKWHDCQPVHVPASWYQPDGV